MPLDTSGGASPPRQRRFARRADTAAAAASGSGRGAGAVRGQHDTEEQLREALFGGSASGKQPEQQQQQQQPSTGRRPPASASAARDAGRIDASFSRDTGELRAGSRYAVSASNATEDDVEQLRQQATAAAREGRDVSKRTLKIAQETRGIGVDVSSKLDEQGEQLDRIQGNVDDTHGQLTQSDEIIRDMRSFWRKLWPWSGYSSGKNRGGGGGKAPKFKDVPGRGEGEETSEARRDVRNMQRKREQGTLNKKHADDEDEEEEAAANDNGTGGDERGGSHWRRERHAVSRKVRGDENTEEREERERGELFAAPGSDASSTAQGGRSRRWMRKGERQQPGKAAESSADDGGGDGDGESGGAYGSRRQQSYADQDSVNADEQPWERYVQQQDRDLDEVAEVVRDLNTLAHGINEQVTAQSVQVDNVSKDVDYARDRVQYNNRRVRRLM